MAFEKCHSHEPFITATHLVEGQDLVMAIEYSGIFIEPAADSCFSLTYDIFTQWPQCRRRRANESAAVAQSKGGSTEAIQESFVFSSRHLTSPKCKATHLQLIHQPEKHLTHADKG